MFSEADIARSRGHPAIAVQRPDCMSAVSVTPQLLGQVQALLYVVAGEGKRDALAALEARKSNLIACRAVQQCPAVEVWFAFD